MLRSVCGRSALKLHVLVRGYWAKFSRLGLVLAALSFAASLTPSLLPRHFVVQGLLSGVALAVGYGVGAMIQGIWTFLELRMPSVRIERLAGRITLAGSTLLAIYALWCAVSWQNSIRRLMEMEPVSTAYPIRVAAIACLTAVTLIAASRGVRKCWLFLQGKVNRVVPRRVSYLLSGLLVALILILTVTRVLGTIALNVAEAAFLELDKLVEEDVEQPAEQFACGSTGSLVEWDFIGRRGKHFIADGPTQQQIEQFWNEPAKRPVRVYVGLRSKNTTEEAAQLALRELIRAGGFSRSVLVIATPTGTGWLDPGGVDTIEYLHRGDTAIVSLQYSFLPSWITILVDPERSRHAAAALFNEVYGHWRTLPKETRPKLYLHGLSLGALGSEASADLFTVFEDPIHGGVFSGPPFPSAVWSRVTKNRKPDSPIWLPKFRDGSMIRFMGRENLLGQGDARWGPMRFVYIQHASDPMSFFAPELFYRNPDWLVGERGPDVSPSLRWYPIVTSMQIAFDLPMSTTVPTGYGHNFAPASYIDAWIEVTQPGRWKGDQTARLKKLFAK